jgi:hypothetical protein
MQIFFVTVFTSLLLISCSSDTSESSSTSCEENETLENGTCISKTVSCEENETLENGICISKTISCEENETLENGICISKTISCEENETLENGICIFICGENEIFEDGECYIVEETTKRYTSLYLSGVAIDGYVKGAKVKVGNRTAETNGTGGWIIEFEENDTVPEDGEVEVSGGVDISTGEAYEGVLRTVFDREDIKEKIEPIPVTPLTNLVATKVKMKSISKREAEQEIANYLGVSEDALRKDTIKVLNSGSDSEKIEASYLIQQAFIIQKSAEAIAKSIDEFEFEVVFSAVVKTISEDVERDGKLDLKSSFENNSSEFAKRVVDSLGEENSTKKSVLSMKLETAVSISAKVITTVEQIDMAILSKNGLDSVSKATELFTQNIEKEMVEISKMEIPEEHLFEELEEMKAGTEDIANSVIAMGGVEALSNEIKKFSDEAMLFSQDGDEVVVYLDNMNILDDEVIQKYSNMYDDFHKIGFSDEAIIKTSFHFSELEEKDFFIDALIQKEEEIAKRDGVPPPPIDEDILFEMRDELDDRIVEADELMDTKIFELLNSGDIFFENPPEPEEPEVIEPEVIEPEEPEVIEPVSSDSDYLEVSTVQFGEVSVIGETILRDISNGEFPDTVYESYAYRDISEINTGIAKNLFTISFPISNYNLENETKEISILLLVEETNSSRSEKFTYSDIQLSHYFGDFSIDLENAKLFSKDDVLNGTDYLKFENNSFTLYFSQLFEDDFINDSRYRVIVGISGVSGIRNGESFSNSYYGFSGEIEIERKEPSSVVVPPPPPSLN